MFFQGERVDLMREMIFVCGNANRPRCGSALPLQRADFMKYSKSCRTGFIRLFDAPLHEFCLRENKACAIWPKCLTPAGADDCAGGRSV
jgi:hypothetical protein